MSNIIELVSKCRVCKRYKIVSHKYKKCLNCLELEIGKLKESLIRNTLVKGKGKSV